MNRLTIHAGRVIDPANNLDGIQDVFIENGRILTLGAPPEGFTPDQVIDAQGCIVCPGLIDLAARIREPGAEHKADIASECQAAVAAGITTLCIPPDSDPVVDTPAVVELIQHRAAQAGGARIVILGALSKDLRHQTLSEMAELKAAGCVGISDGGRPVSDSAFLRHAMDYASTFDLPVHLTPVDPALGANGCAHDGMVATRLGLPGIPVATETAALARDLALFEETGARGHIGRLSSARALTQLLHAKQLALPVSCDVSTHHLHLTEMDLLGYNSDCNVLPPLRTQLDRDQLRKALKTDVIDAICSDHQPHDVDAKQAPFCAAEPGISALESFLPLALRMHDEHQLALPALIAKITATPARILGIEYGQLSPGTIADIVIFDPNEEWTLNTDTLLSRGKNSPFAGWSLKGRVRFTLLDGQIKYRHDV